MAKFYGKFKHRCVFILEASVLELHIETIQENQPIFSEILCLNEPKFNQFLAFSGTSIDNIHSIMYRDKDIWTCTLFRITSPNKARKLCLLYVYRFRIKNDNGDVLLCEVKMMNCLPDG